MANLRGIPALTWLVPLFATGLYAQDRGVSARDLFYEKDIPAESNGVTPAAAGTPVPGVHHLGLRYRLLKIQPSTRVSQAVDPDGNFGEGDCFAVEFVPNREGRLYVFNFGSSKEWRQLMPSPLMPDEVSMVKAGATVRVPQEFCFQIDDRKGVETLMVAVTDDQQDMERLRPALQASAKGASETNPRAPNPVLASDQITSWQTQQLAGRDIVMETLSEVQANGERSYSVYAVRRTSAEASHLVVEIKIRHE